MVGFIAPLTVVTLVVVVIRRSAAASGRTAGVMPTSISVWSLLPTACSSAGAVTRRLTFNGGYRSEGGSHQEPLRGHFLCLRMCH